MVGTYFARRWLRAAARGRKEQPKPVVGRACHAWSGLFVDRECREKKRCRAFEEKSTQRLSAAAKRPQHVSAQPGQAPWEESSSGQQPRRCVLLQRRPEAATRINSTRSRSIPKNCPLARRLRADRAVLESGQIGCCPATQLFARYRNGPLEHTPADRRLAGHAPVTSHHSRTPPHDARVPGTVPGPGSDRAPDAPWPDSLCIDDAAAPLQPPHAARFPRPRCWRAGCDTTSPDNTPRQTWLHPSPSPPRASDPVRRPLRDCCILSVPPHSFAAAPAAVGRAASTSPVATSARALDHVFSRCARHRPRVCHRRDVVSSACRSPPETSSTPLFLTRRQLWTLYELEAIASSRTPCRPPRRAFHTRRLRLPTPSVIQRARPSTSTSTSTARREASTQDAEHDKLSAQRRYAPSRHATRTPHGRIRSQPRPANAPGHATRLRTQWPRQPGRTHDGHAAWHGT